MFSKRQKIAIILKHSLRAIAIVVVASLVIFTISRQISKTGDILVEKKKLSLILERKNETVAELRQDLNLIGSRDVQVKNAFPPADNILEFLNKLESLAAKYNLKQLYKFSTPVLFKTDEKTGLTISVVDYNLTLEGNVTDLLNYLHDFETLPYFSTILSLNLSSLDANKGWAGPSTVSLQAKLYVK